MNRSTPVSSGWLFRSGLLIAALATGCTLEQPGFAPDAGSPFIDGGQDTTALYGFSWDPEAVLYNYGYCGGSNCPVQPSLSPQDPLYTHALIANANVVVMDPTTGQPAASAPAPSKQDGTWSVPAVPSTTSGFYVLMGAGGDLVPVNDPNIPLPPVPPASYVPTLTMRPVQTNYSACAFMQAPEISTGGYLEAVAKYLSGHGKPTVVQDFLDPSKYGGVLVVQLIPPGDPTSVAPAPDTTVQASVGQVFTMDWIPPDAPVPAGLKAMESTRGFIVNNDFKNSSPIGLMVITVPSSASTGSITFSAVDTVSDANQGRPWASGPVTLPLIPTVIGFAPVSVYPTVMPPGGFGGGGGPSITLPPWLCLPM